MPDAIICLPRRWAKGAGAGSFAKLQEGDFPKAGGNDRIAHNHVFGEDEGELWSETRPREEAVRRRGAGQAGPGGGGVLAIRPNQWSRRIDVCRVGLVERITAALDEAEGAGQEAARALMAAKPSML